MRSRHWRAYSIAAGVWAAGFGTFDAVTHQWWDVPIMAGLGSVSVIFGRMNVQHAARKEREAHRPDYAKIRRLEIELGMREPELKPQAGSVFAGAYHPWSMPPATPPQALRHSQGSAPNGHRCWMPGEGTCYNDCGIMSWGKCPHRPPDLPATREPPPGMIPGSFAEYEWRMRRWQGK